MVQERANRLRVLLLAETQEKSESILRELYEENTSQIDLVHDSILIFKDGSTIRAVSVNVINEKLLGYNGHIYDQVITTDYTYRTYHDTMVHVLGRILRTSSIPREFVLTILDKE